MSLFAALVRSNLAALSPWRIIVLHEQQRFPRIGVYCSKSSGEKYHHE